MSGEQISYAAFCRTCGALVAAAVDHGADLDTQAGHRLAAWKREQWRDGLKLRRVASERVRQELASCSCAPAMGKEPR